MVKILSNGEIAADNDPRARPYMTSQAVIIHRGRCDSHTSSGSSSSSDEPAVIGPPLAIHRIDLSREDVSVLNGITYFGITFVDGANPVRRRVIKRYSEFRELADDLELCDEAFGYNFPRKHLTGCTGGKLEKRRLGLEMWLRGALFLQRNYPDMRPALRDFLGEAEAAVAPAPVMISQGFAPPPAMAAQAAMPCAPFHQVPLPGSATPSPAITTLEVQIPPGMQAGQSLQVALPDGRQAVAIVPQGYSGGMMARFAFDAQDGSLTFVS